jgi:hypothetical protein
MRYTPFLNKLIREYNSSPQSLEKQCQLIAETKDSKNNRSRNPQEPMIFEINKEKGDFWGKEDGDDPNVYWLLLKDDYQINQHNFPVIDSLFECRYSSNKTNNPPWELIRPAKLKLPHFEHEARGILILPQDILEKHQKFPTTEYNRESILNEYNRESILNEYNRESILKSKLYELEQNLIYQEVYTRLKDKILSDVYDQLNSLTPNLVRSSP